MENAFRNKGYFTFAMHANDGNYWNRKNMYNTLGYDAFMIEIVILFLLIRKMKIMLDLG